MSTLTPFTRSKRASKASMQGFSIIEIMVGMVIGLLTLLAIYQLYTTSEGRRRTVVSTSQAQSTGALALFAIERDIRSAGIGFASMDTAYLGCSVQASNSKRSPVAFQFPLQPVQIINGNELRVLTGSSGNMFVGARYSASNGGEFSMLKTNAGFQAGDIAIGTSDTDQGKCLMMEVTRGVGAVVTQQGGGAPEPYLGVDHKVAGTYTNYYTGANAVATHNGSQNNILDGGASALGEGFLYSLGPTPSLNVWSVSNNQLMRFNWLEEATNTKNMAVAEDVMQMAAEYGFDSNGNGVIDGTDEWTASDSSIATPNLSKVIAVRVAILVRSSQFERDAVTTEAPRWANGNKTFSMGAGSSDWQHYRYRVYESVIPLRNTIWGQMK
ncbi:PilW family protein [Comamonas sp. J-3]|uniref:PilW family protein n=1 Tax=Comamonas trifloxystrobinivorans TaxID=3350256 RepID=UPI00372BC183